MRFFRSPNAGRTSLSLQHDTSPRSGYRPPAGHNADGYTMPERVGFKKGGWIQDVNKSIKKRGTKGSVHLLQKKVALEEQKR